MLVNYKENYRKNKAIKISKILNENHQRRKKMVKFETLVDEL